MSDADDALRESARRVRHAGPRVAVPRGPPLFTEATKVAEQSARYATAVRNWFILGALCLTVSVCVLAVTYVDEWLVGHEFTAVAISGIAGLGALRSFAAGETNLRRLQTLLRLTIRST